MVNVLLSPCSTIMPQTRFLRSDTDSVPGCNTKLIPPAPRIPVGLPSVVSLYRPTRWVNTRVLSVWSSRLVRNIITEPPSSNRILPPRSDRVRVGLKVPIQPRFPRPCSFIIRMKPLLITILLGSVPCPLTLSATDTSPRETCKRCSGDTKSSFRSPWWKIIKKPTMERAEHSSKRLLPLSEGLIKSTPRLL